MAKFIGWLSAVIGALGGIVIGCAIAVLGVIDIVDGAKADPTDGVRIFWGIIQLCALAAPVGWIIFFIFAAVGAGIASSGGSSTTGTGSGTSPLGSSAFRREYEWNRRLRGE